MTEVTIQKRDGVKNTRLTYLYRDAHNNKQSHTIIVAGELSFVAIAPYLDEGIYFIPQQVGLEALQTRFGDTLTTGDHPWHELYAENVESTHTAPTLAVTAPDLLERFRTVGWDDVAASKALGIPIGPLFSPGQSTATQRHSAEEKASVANDLATFAEKTPIIVPTEQQEPNCYTILAFTEQGMRGLKVQAQESIEQHREDIEHLNELRTWLLENGPDGEGPTALVGELTHHLETMFDSKVSELEEHISVLASTVAELELGGY